MKIIKKIFRSALMIAALVTSSLMMSNCLNENSSSFGFFTRESASEANITTNTENPDGTITVVDTWNNLQSLAKKATILISIDASSSLDDEINFLADRGIKALVERFANEFETYFAVVGAYSNYPTYTDHSSLTLSNAVELSNGLVVNNPAGKLLPPNNLNTACVSVNDYSTTDDVVNAVKANFDLRGNQSIGVGEAMVKSVHTLFTTPSLINPVINAGKCFADDHTIIVVSMSDETDYTLCPRDYSKAENYADPQVNNNPNDGDSWDVWGINVPGDVANFDADCGTATNYREHSSDIVGSLLHSSYNSVSNTWEMNESVDSVEADLRAFAGSLPFYWAAVGYDESNYTPNKHESPAYAEIDLASRFSDNTQYHIPMQYARTSNEAAFSAAFNDLAEQLKEDASYLNIFDTQLRCPGSAIVKVDGQTLSSSQYIELSLTRVSIKSPHNQGQEIKIEYTLDTGAGGC